MANVIINDVNLTNIANAIRGKNGSSDTYKPSEMPDAIANLPTGGADIEPIVLSGNCGYTCVGPLSTQFIKQYGDKISTNNVLYTTNMFYNSELETCPFEINCSTTQSQDMSYMFNAALLNQLPKINNGYPNNMYYFVYGMARIKEIPDDYFEGWNWNYMQTNTNAVFTKSFYYDYSLRKIPSSYLKNAWGITTDTTNNMYNNYGYMYALDDLKGVPVAQTVELTTNLFGAAFTNLYRVKDITFETNEDGSPKTANWTSQSINLTNYVGYARYANMVKNYCKYSGVGETEQITNATTYQSYKDSDNSWTALLAYSRYNHDSAVNTINSLPDTSAYGTNYIRFKGTSGSSTEGGAINTLTDAEIAVATAKGWTVSFS